MVTSECYHGGRQVDDRLSPHAVASTATRGVYPFDMTLPATTNPTALNRQTNLTVLVNRRAEGNASAFGTLVGKDRRQISAWMTGRKAMADETAREIEKALRLDRGWMDREHPLESQNRHDDSRKESRSQRIDLEKMREAMELAKFLAEYRDEPEMATDPTYIAYAYEVLVEFDTPLGTSNVLDLTKRLASRLKGDGNATQESGAPARDRSVDVSTD